MVAHEHVSMHCHPVAVGKLSTQFKIKKVILGFDEAGFAVVAALDDMVRQARQIHPGTAGHRAFVLRVTDKRYGTRRIHNWGAD